MGVSCEDTTYRKEVQNMVDRNRLKGVIVMNGKTQEDVANHLGMSTKTFYLRMKNGVFGSDEIEKMVDFLHIEDPMPIFFAKEVS
jgi:uncharacterized protein YerC